MKSYRKELWFDTPKRVEFVNITPQVEQCLKESSVHEGIALVNAMHITASIYVNDDESGLIQDIEELLQRLAPEGPDYQHHRTGETNGDAHLKRLLIGHQAVIPITDGKLDLGPWEQIYYAEFDGQRRKRVLLKAIGE